MSSRPRLLVARPGAIGDICMLVPLVHALARRYEVHWLVRETHRPLLERFLPADCVPVPLGGAELERGLFEPSLLARLAAADYAAMIDFSHWRSMRRLAGLLPTIPVRATTVDPRQDALLGIPPPEAGEAGAFTIRLVVPDGIHQSAKWRLLVRAACGVDVAPAWPLPARAPLDPARPLRLFVHPHAGKRGKIWPAGRFATVVAHLARERPVACSVNRVAARTLLELRWRLLLGGLGLRSVPQDPRFDRLAAGLDACDLAIGCDSGPMQFAALRGVPTVVVYGRYPAAEFAPLWRSVAVSPPAGNDAEAVPAAAVSAAVRTALARLAAGFPDETGSPA